MAHVKRENPMFIFPDRENAGNLPKNIKIGFYKGSLSSTQGNFEVLKIIG